VELTFQVVDQRQHEIAPGAAILNDSLGQPQFAESLLDPATCTTSDGGVSGPGGKVGPTPLCFEAGGPVNGTLSLDWSGASIRLP
jgi:hypothetical protein